jgi:hypothetical protein
MLHSRAMTDREQDQAIGELARRYADLKGRRAALLATAHKWSVACYELQHSLGLMGRVPIAVPANFPDRGELQSFLDDWTTTNGDLDRCRQLLKDSGVDMA